MVSFRDPVHGDLTFDGVIEELIATEEFQRLCDVKQLGLTDKVYPGANHTRFSHALGVCYIAGQMAARLDVPAKDRILIEVAALLHDIGHYDFSHALEHLAPYDHEKNSAAIILGTARLPMRKSGGIASVLRKHKINPKQIVQLLHHDGDYPAFYYSILSSQMIDADRMDYLKRDTYYTGAMIGEIDIERLLSVLRVHPKTKELGIMNKGVPSLEQFLVARMHMYQQVYLHPDTEAGETMLRKAVESSRDVAQPLLYGDGHLLARLIEQGTPLSKELVRRIRAGKRAFYTPAIIIDPTGNPKNLTAKIMNRIEELHKKEELQPGFTEKILLKNTRLKEGQLLVSFPGAQKRAATLSKFPVQLNDGTWRDFFDVSPIAKTAAMERISKTMLVIYTMPEHAKIVKRETLALLIES